MYPIILSFGRFNIYTHGLMIAIGAVCGGMIIYWLAKRKGEDTSFLFDVLIYSLLAGLIGARILYVIIYYNQFANWKEIFQIWYGGLVSYGGIAAGLITAWIFLKLKKKSVARWFDLGIIGLMIGWAVGRVGCFLNGDCLGIVSSSKIAIWGRIPTQLFESIWALIIALGCFLLLGRKAKLNLSDGTIFWIGLGGYALGRFVIDFFRDEVALLWVFKAGQIASLIVLFTTLVILWFNLRRRNRASI